MDHGRFGTLTTTLANATSRRAALRGVVAILAGGATATVADGASAATSCRRGRQTCQRNNQCCSGTCQTGKAFSLRDRNRCTCEDGLVQCSNACVDTDTDMRHCGACGNRCGAGDRCVGGQCRIDQQCYTADSGLCYMTPDGREHRADGIYFAHILDGNFEPVACQLSSECGGAHPICAYPGVRCTCVRAFDLGGGYVEPQDSGTGICLPLLDNGDDEITCREDWEERICLYTAAERELLVCYDSTVEQGPCIGATCAGVGACDDQGVTCACVIAIKLPLFGTKGVYIDLTIGGDLLEPTCFSYREPVAGECTQQG